MTGLGTSKRRAADDSGVAGPRRTFRLWPPEISWNGPAALAARAGAAGASLTPAALWRNHRLFTVAALVSVLPRVVAALGFSPAPLITDAFSYMAAADHLTPLNQIRPAGYPLLLWVLKPFHSLLLVTTLQHLMGLAVAAIVYGVLRTRGLPAWGATLAAAPTLFDSREIWQEHRPEGNIHLGGDPRPGRRHICGFRRTATGGFRSCVFTGTVRPVPR